MPSPMTSMKKRFGSAPGERSINFTGSIWETLGNSSVYPRSLRESNVAMEHDPFIQPTFKGFFSDFPCLIEGKSRSLWIFMAQIPLLVPLARAPWRPTFRKLKKKSEQMMRNSLLG